MCVFATLCCLNKFCFSLCHSLLPVSFVISLKSEKNTVGKMALERVLLSWPSYLKHLCLCFCWFDSSLLVGFWGYTLWNISISSDKLAMLLLVTYWSLLWEYPSYLMRYCNFSQWIWLSKISSILYSSSPSTTMGGDAGMLLLFVYCSNKDI